LPNPFEKELGIPLPKCCSLGSCCKGASPSTPYHQLLKRASDGDDFARGFFSIMVPYKTHSEAEAVVPGVVERTLKAAKKLEEFKSPDDIVFYQCQYQTADNKCGVWEDRPQFCRDYPDTPFVVMAPGCAFEPWAKACKEKYLALKDEVAQLKTLKAELDTLKSTQTTYRPANTKIDAPFLESHNADDLESGLSLVLSLTNLYISSPLSSIRFMR
jgi:Fe-S-cluster containining protein